MIFMEDEMVDPPGPLGDAATFIQFVSDIFVKLFDSIKDIPIIGEYLASPFWWVGFRLAWVAHYLRKADERIEGINITDILERPLFWVLTRLGMPWYEFPLWAEHLWAWLLYRFGLSRLDALMFEASPVGFIITKVVEKWPFLTPILKDPRLWVRRRLEEAWSEFEEIRTHPRRWALRKIGATAYEAAFWETNPWGWVKQKIRSTWPDLARLLDNPKRFVWDKFRDAVDDYLPLYLDWLVKVLKDTLNRLWQMTL